LNPLRKNAAAIQLHSLRDRCLGVYFITFVAVGDRQPDERFIAMWINRGRLLEVCPPKMLSDANAFEISNLREAETEASLDQASRM
jgi:hypothetical protein